METPVASTDQWKLPEPGIGEDLLSSLPDEVLSYILSFLQTKHAFCTSVLSRRWKDLWTRVSNLDLDNYRLTNSYLDSPRFFDRVMSEHKNLNSLKRFRLHLSGKYRKVVPKFWSKMELESASSNLEEIDVGLSYYIDRIPECFYTLKNLRVLKLRGVMMMITARGFVFLPSLKVLQLSQVILDDTSLTRFISGCPVLETAHLEKCYCSSIINQEHKVTASLPCLKNLTVIGSPYLDTSIAPIVIEAPSLEHLQLQNFEWLEIVGNSPLSCLESARIDICEDGQISHHSLIVLLTQVSNAKQIWLSWLILVLLSDVVKEVPVFPKLIHLTIEPCGDTRTLHSLLNSASKLQTLVIDLGDDEGFMDWKKLEPVCTSECLLPSLEEIEINDLKVIGDGMKMARYLLKAGAVLKRVNVNLHSGHFGIGPDMEERKKLAALLKLPRG